MKSLILNSEMVRAVLENRKTMHRVPVKPMGVLDGPSCMGYVWNPDGQIKGPPIAYCDDLEKLVKEQCPLGKVGDKLWVKEPWIISTCIESLNKENEGKQTILYRATKPGYLPDSVKWKSTVTMPQWASRIKLEITDIRVEKIQDISEEDAEAEGVDFMRHYPDSDPSFKAKMLFEGLWDSVYEKKGYGWDTNCYVWVREFKKMNGL